MVNRLIGAVSLLAMLAANAALFYSDVLPNYIGDPPQPVGLSLEPNQSVSYQLGIFNDHNERLGWSWSTHRRANDGQITVRCTTIILGAVVNGLALPTLRLDTSLHFNSNNELDTLALNVNAAGHRLELKGELVPPDQFPCTWSLGNSQSGSFLLPARATRGLGDAIRPFDGVTGLHVGQSWRLQVVNPVSDLLPGLGSEFALEPILVKVVRRERLERPTGPLDAFVVEAPSMTVWVADDGRVLRQQTDLPVLGRLTLESESYDHRLQQQVLDEFNGGS